MGVDSFLQIVYNRYEGETEYEYYKSSNNRPHPKTESHTENAGGYAPRLGVASKEVGVMAEQYKDSSQQRLMREVQKGRDRMRTIPIE
jgi:hypothetical protein